MEQIEYIGKIMDDGHIYLPETVQRQLKLEPDFSVHVILSVQETKSFSADQGWSVFKATGKEDQAGCLQDASENHDRYLY
jgi:hypothetical protein